MFWRILSIKLRNLDFIPTATWHHQSGERGQYQTATGMRRQWGMRGELLGGTTIGQTGVHWAWIRRKHPSQEAEAASTELSSWLDEGWEPRVDASHSLGQYFFSFSTSESPGRLVRIQIVGPTLGVSDSNLEQSPRNCIPSKLPGDAAIVGPRNTLWELMLQVLQAHFCDSGEAIAKGQGRQERQ